jgi:GNAT superfamily N-acetyltransferase
MNERNWTVRRMDRREVDLAVEWASGEGWNPGLGDAEAFFSADPAGFFMAVEGHQPVGTVSAVAYDGAFGFLGFYIVRPDRRGRGIGMSLWKKALEHLGNRNVGLDGVEAQIGNYEKSGFRLAYNNVRYEGIVSSRPSVSGTVPLTAVPIEKVLRFDRRFFPASRQRFLEKWISPEKGRSLAEVREGELDGYGTIRACRKGWKIGPLFAENEAAAETIFTGLTAAIPPGDPVYLDVPGPNAAAVALAERHGMKPVFRTARMYNLAFPDLPLEKIFGVTTFELG